MAKKRGGGPRLSFWESLFVHSDFRVVGHEMVNVYEKDFPGVPFYPKHVSGQEKMEIISAVREHRGPKATCRLCQKHGTAHKFQDQFSDKGKLILALGLLALLPLIAGGVGLLYSLAK